MTPGAGPAAVTVRRTGIAIVLVACVLGTIVNHGEVLRVMVDWLAFALYLFCCAEPLRRVVRGAGTPAAVMITYVVAALACVVIIFALPVTYYDGGKIVQSAVFARLGGVGSLSDGAAQRYLAVSWSAFAVVVVATFTLWALIARLARRTEWQAMDHAVGR